MFSFFFQYAKAKKPAAPCCEGLAGFGRREDERGVQRCYPGAYARVQLVMPSVVAIAVKMLMAI